MNVETTRFGVVDVDESRIITFPTGLLGFSSFTRYALLQPDEDAAFFWLQCIDAPELAFVVTDPSLWVRDYQVPIRREQMDELGLDKLENPSKPVGKVIMRFSSTSTTPKRVVSTFI